MQRHIIREIRSGASELRSDDCLSVLRMLDEYLGRVRWFKRKASQAAGGPSLDGSSRGNMARITANTV